MADLLSRLNTVLDTNDFLSIASLTAHDHDLQKEVLRVKTIHQTLLLQMVYLLQKYQSIRQRLIKSDSPPTIGFLGLGVLGRVLLNSVLRDGRSKKLLVSCSPGQEVLQSIYQQLDVHQTTSEQLLVQSDLVVITMNNRMHNDQLFDLRNVLVKQKNKMFLCMMPDLTHLKFAQLCEYPEVAFISPSINYSKMGDLQALFEEEDNTSFLDNTRHDKIEKTIYQHLFHQTKPIQLVTTFCKHFGHEPSLGVFLKEGEEQEEVSPSQMNNKVQGDFIDQLREYYAQHKHA